MKKFKLAMAFAVLFAASNFSIAKLECTEVVGCSGSASCDFGDPTGCLIRCSDGTMISCNYKSIKPNQSLEE